MNTKQTPTLAAVDQPRLVRRLRNYLRQLDAHQQKREAATLILEAADEIERLTKKFTKLDKPKHSGDPMLDAVLAETNPDFRAWVDSLPTTYWARYDLSAARIGWEAASKFILPNAKEHPTT